MIIEQFYWLQITKAIQMYCRRCEQCPLFKADTWELAGLYQPLDILQTPWESIHIKFVMELLEDDGYRTIMTYVDRFSKMVVLLPLCETNA